jgi:putative Ca2+/H+ antiporter (TMEM165/GDT1 family)
MRGQSARETPIRIEHESAAGTISYGINMDWKLTLSTFTAIFLAEMGDKTQLAIFSLTSTWRKPLPVFIGGAAALIAVTALGVLLGEAVLKFLPAAILNKVAAILFIGIGFWIWFKG